jgi:hypothetical protein
MYGFQVKCRGRDLQENFQNMTLKNKSCQIIHVLFTNGTNGVKVYSKLNLSFSPHVLEKLKCLLWSKVG